MQWYFLFFISAIVVANGKLKIESNQAAINSEVCIRVGSSIIYIVFIYVIVDLAKHFIFIYFFSFKKKIGLHSHIFRPKVIIEPVWKLILNWSSIRELLFEKNPKKKKKMLRLVYFFFSQHFWNNLCSCRSGRFNVIITCSINKEI